MGVGQCQIIRETTMELYIRRLRFWSRNVCYKCIVCLTHPLFSNLGLFITCRHYS